MTLDLKAVIHEEEEKQDGRSALIGQGSADMRDHEASCIYSSAVRISSRPRGQSNVALTAQRATRPSNDTQLLDGLAEDRSALLARTGSLYMFHR